MTTLDSITETTGAPEPHVARYDELARRLAPDWIQPLRERGLSRFLELGFPTTQLENWRTTNVSAIARTPYTLPDAPFESEDIAASSNALRRPAVGHRLVFVNGLFSPELSILDRLPESVVVTGLARALSTHRDLVEPRLGAYADLDTHAFAALNTALLQDGAFVFIPDGTALSEPLELVFHSTAGEGPRLANIRNLIVTGENAQLRIVERYEGSSEPAHLTLVMTELLMGAGSVVDLSKAQQEPEDGFHISILHVHQERDSRFTSSSISLGAALARNDIFVRLAGEGSGCVLDGLYIVGGTQHVDHHTEIDHAKPHCDSVELYKGVLDGRSRGVFDGRIVVRKDAQKTNSAQTNNNLILSELATVDTKPQLEIYADDVKCTHGSTIGQLDEDAMFYLRSRGISVEDSRNLLIYAFASEVVQRIRIVPLRDELQAILLQKLPGNGHIGGAS